MNQLLLNAIVLAFTSTISSLPTSSDSYLTRRAFNNFYPGYGAGGFNGGYGGGYGGYGGYGGFNNFGSSGFPVVINNNRFRANTHNFNLNEFDRNKKAAVFVDNIHKKDINKNHINVNKHDNVATI